jgi:hypothetical protein
MYVNGIIFWIFQETFLLFVNGCYTSCATQRERNNFSVAVLLCASPLCVLGEWQYFIYADLFGMMPRRHGVWGVLMPLYTILICLFLNFSFVSFCYLPVVVEKNGHVCDLAGAHEFHATSTINSVSTDNKQ